MISWFEKNIFVGKRPYFIIISLAFLVYLPALFFGFTYLDDNTLILDNQNFLSSFWNIFPAFQTDVFHLFGHSAFYYRPMLTVSFIFDYQFGGSAPFMYHLTSLALHIISACLVFSLFKKLKYRKDLSFFFSLIFAIHPILSQAVIWIPGRNDSLLAVFILSAFINFLNFLESKDRKYIWRYFLFFALAIFTKESALVIVPIQMFYFYFIYRTSDSENIQLAKKSKNSNKSRFRYRNEFTRNLKIMAAGWIFLIGLFFLMRHAALKGSVGMEMSEMFKSIFSNLPAVVQFIGKVFFPFNLSVLPIIQDTTFVYGIMAAIILLGIIFFTKNKRWPFVLFGLGWFFAFLIPSFIRPNSALVADFIEHRMYVPIIGFFILIMETSLIQKWNIGKKISLVISISILLLFCVISLYHGQNFKNRLAFWKNAAENSPHYPLAHRNLGAMFYLDGKKDEAESEFKKALELNPKEEMAHNNLGLIYMDRGDFQKAEEEFSKELEINPYYDNCYANRGILYFNMERYDEALDSWKRTLEINPGYSQALYNIFAYYYQKQDKDQATYWANEARKKGIPLLPEMQRILNPVMTLPFNK